MGLHENMLNEQVRHLELREAIKVWPRTTVREAIEKMRSKRLGCVMVTNDDGVLLGIFTERIVMNLLVESPASLDETVEAHMATDFVSVKESDSIAKVVAAMMTDRRRFLCVFDDEGTVVALTGQLGLVEYITEHFPRRVLTQSPGAKVPSEREGA